MDRFTEELVKAGVFVAAAGLKERGIDLRSLPSFRRLVRVACLPHRA